MKKVIIISYPAFLAFVMPHLSREKNVYVLAAAFPSPVYRRAAVEPWQVKDVAKLNNICSNIGEMYILEVIKT